MTNRSNAILTGVTISVLSAVVLGTIWFLWNFNGEMKARDVLAEARDAAMDRQFDNITISIDEIKENFKARGETIWPIGSQMLYQQIVETRFESAERRLDALESGR